MSEMNAIQELQPTPEENIFFNDIILKAEKITKIFPGTVALENVTYNVYKGKVNVLIGENGAGKSTLMKILAGVEQPSDGRVLLDGHSSFTFGCSQARNWNYLSGTQPLFQLERG